MQGSDFDEGEFFRTSGAVREVIRAYSDRILSAAEVEAYLSAPMSPDEKADALDLIAWFRRRYPTPAERLAYVRRAYRRWTRALG